MTEIDSTIYTDSNFIQDIATKVIDKLLQKKMYILTTKSLDRQQKTDENILCDIINTTKTNLLAEPNMCKKGPVIQKRASSVGTFYGGDSKKRNVTIKSYTIPKTVKGLKTRKKLLKKRIKKAEKKVKLSKNRIIRLK